MLYKQEPQNRKTNLNAAVFVTIPSFRPARFQYSLNSKSWHVTFEEVVAGPDKKHRVIRLDSVSPKQLMEDILREFPDAVFSETNPVPQDPAAEAKAALQALRDEKPVGTIVINGRVFDEIERAYDLLTRTHGVIRNGAKVLPEGFIVTEELCRKEGIRSKVFEALKDRAQESELDIARRGISEFATTLTPKQRASYNSEVLFEFTTASEKNLGWVAWFAAHQGFLSWPGNTGENRKILLAYCLKTFGDTLWTHEQLGSAMNVLLTAGSFHKQSTPYKRSETWKRDAVAPLPETTTGESPVTESEIQRAVTALTGRFGVPLKCNIERLQAVGIANPQRIFDALQARYNVADTKMTAAEIKDAANADRVARRGPASRAQADKTYL